MCECAEKILHRKKTPSLSWKREWPELTPDVIPTVNIFIVTCSSGSKDVQLEDLIEK